MKKQKKPKNIIWETFIFEIPNDANIVFCIHARNFIDAFESFKSHLKIINNGSQRIN